MFGQTKENIMAAGLKIKCMVLVFFIGQMEKDTKEVIYKIKKRVMGNFIGLTEIGTRDIGKEENKMEKEYFLTQTKI